MKSAVIVTDQPSSSDLPVAVTKKLQPFGLLVKTYQILSTATPQDVVDSFTTTLNTLPYPLQVVIVAFENANKQPRSSLDTLQQLQGQYSTLIDHELRMTMEIVYMCMPLLIRNAQPPFQPSTIILLGNRMCRTPNSPQQIIVSAEKKALMAFAGSLFFEKRMQGIRVTCIHPVQVSSDHRNGLVYEDVADAITLPFRVGPVSCVESIDLVNVIPRKLIELDKRKGTVFVTGGSRGIGASIAIACARELGLNVALVGRDEQALSNTKAAVAKHVGIDQVLTFCFDVRDNNALKNAMDSTAKRFGGIAVLVCSAGINRRRNSVSADGKVFSDPVIWQDVININVNSTMAATGYVLPHLIHNRTTIASTVFFIGSRNIRVGGAPGQSTYVASKMAIAGFAQSLQQELKGHGVRCITLNVGLVATELGTKPPTGEATKQVFKPAPAAVQISPEDVASLCVFSLRDCASHVSPTSIDVCGTQDEFVASDGKGLKLSQL